MNQESGAPSRVDSSELARNGVILWRMAKDDQADLWCLVFEVNDSFSLVLDDNPTGTKPFPLTEGHADIETLMHRAGELKTTLTDAGWAELDVE